MFVFIDGRGRVWSATAARTHQGLLPTLSGHPLGRAEWSLSRVEQPLTITAITIDDKPCLPVVEK